MNNYCRNSGEKLTNSSACEKCGTKILTNRVGELDRLLEKKYIMIFFAIVMIYVIIFVLLHEFIVLLFGFLPQIFIAFVIDAKEKLKYSKFFNIVFWIMLLLIIVFMLFILFKIMQCDYYRL